MAKDKYWDGTAWQEVGASANKVTLIDNGNIINATDVEGALQEIVSEFDLYKADNATSVKARGAKGDLVTDDSAIFQTLINLGITSISLPEGNYLISKLDIGSHDVTFTGVNKYKSIITIDNLVDGFDGIYSHLNMGKVIFKNLSIVALDGNEVADNSPGSPMSFNNGEELTFEDCYFDSTNMPDASTCIVHIKDTKTLNFNRNSGKYKRNVIYGWSSNFPPTNVVNINVNDNQFETTVASASLIDIDNEPLGVNSVGYYNDVSLCNNVIKSIGVISGKAIGIGRVKNYTVSGNKIFNFTYGIDLDTPMRGMCHDNILINSTKPATGSALRISPVDSYIECMGIFVHDNIIENFNSGITVNQGANVDIHDNSFKNCSTHIRCEITNIVDKGKIKIHDNQFLFYTGNKVLSLSAIANIDVNGNTFEEGEVIVGDNQIIELYSPIDKLDIHDNEFMKSNNKIFVTSSTLNMTNITVRDNKGINDKDISAFIGCTIFEGMEFDNGSYISKYLGLTVPLAYTADSINVLRQYKNKVLYAKSGSTVNEIATVYIDNTIEAFNLTMKSTLPNGEGILKLVLLPTVSSNAVYIHLNCTAEQLNGLTQDYNLVGIYTSVTYLIKGGKYYIIESVPSA